MVITGGGLVRPLLGFVRAAANSSAKGNVGGEGDALRVIAERLVKSRASHSLISLRAAEEEDDSFVKGLHDLISKLPTDHAHELGYQIQRACDDLRGKDDPIAGYKAGATNAKGQKGFGLSAPFFGTLPKSSFLRMDCNEPVEIPFWEGTRGVEAEWGLVLGGDVTRSANSTERITVQDIIDSISHLQPMVEVCEKRISDMPTRLPLKTTLQIGDGAGNGYIVTGPGKSELISPAMADKTNRIAVIDYMVGDALIHLTIDDEEVIEDACGLKEVDGGPMQSLEALANWLADSKHPRGLKAGDMIATGTCTGLTAITGPCLVEARFGQHTSIVRVQFT